MQRTCTNVHHHHTHHIREWFLSCALLLGACGTEAMGAPSPENDNGAIESEAGAARDQESGQADSDDSNYIYVGNFAGEPPANDMFSEPGHTFLFGFVPDGDYVFQVTNAQCTELLAGPGAPGDTPNTEGRIIKAAGGRFEGYPAAPFQTASLDNTGTYIVHVTPVSELGSPSEGCYGFKPEASYTAKFGVVPGPQTDPSYCVSGGVFAAGEGMDGIEVVVFQSSKAQPVTQTFSRGDGMYEVCGLQPGEDYQIKQQLPSGYSPVAPADGTVQVSNFTRDDMVIQPFENQAL